MYDPAKPHKNAIIEAIKSTWRTPYVTVTAGTYPLIRKKFSYPEVDHTDGIGTKGYYHWRRGTFRSAVIDALAMNLNDLALVRAVPYKLSNHITVPTEDWRVLAIIKEVVKECRKRGIAIVGGENSFHDNMDGLDLSMTVSGFLKGKVYKNECRAGDILIGLRSSGLHSNGITTVRRVFRHTVRPEFTVPTSIYLNTILDITQKHQVHGMMHITGGAFTKLKDVLGMSDALITHPKRLWPQKVFFDIHRKGISSKKMYSTFNCGIGFVLSVEQGEVRAILRRVRSADVIGRVVNGSGKVKIISAFDKKTITF